MYKLSAHSAQPHDALTAASAALTTLAFLIADRSELSLEAGACYGLSVLLDAIHADMNKVAEVIESDRRQTAELMAAEYERGFQNGVSNGRRQGGVYQEIFDDLRAQRATGGPVEDDDKKTDMADAQAASGEEAPVPKLTEEGEQGSGTSKSA